MFFGTIASVLKQDGVVEGGTGETKKQTTTQTDSLSEKAKEENE